MKTLDELIDRADPAWPLVQEWIAAATNPVEVLPPPDEQTRQQALLAAQVTTRSPMGAIIFETGGLLVDHGWLRILGSGHPRLPRSLMRWNWGRSCSVEGQAPPFLLVADDVAGGFFAIDGGGLGLERGKVCYHAPDSLKWEKTGQGYSEFLVWSFQGDLAAYYADLRWPGWQDEMGTVGGDQALSIYPPFWADGPPVGQRSRGPISIAEIYGLHVGRRGG